MKPYRWRSLNKQQVGAYAEYFVKMELTMYGFQVYGTEVDDRGIDFVARYENGEFLEVQVKSVRSLGYVYMKKANFELRSNLYLALAVLNEGQPPVLYLIPSLAWKTPSPVFADRDYLNLPSEPEWGLNLSRKNMPELEPYRFDRTVSGILDRKAVGSGA